MSPTTSALAFAAAAGALLLTTDPVQSAPPRLQSFLQKHCLECHDADAKKGGLDLTALSFDLANRTNFSTWVTVHDRVANGEMPPKKKARPDAPELKAFTQALSLIHI